MCTFMIAGTLLNNSALLLLLGMLVEIEFAKLGQRLKTGFVWLRHQNGGEAPASSDAKLNEKRLHDNLGQEGNGGKTDVKAGEA